MFRCSVSSADAVTFREALGSPLSDSSALDPASHLEFGNIPKTSERLYWEKVIRLDMASMLAYDTSSPVKKRFKSL